MLKLRSIYNALAGNNIGSLPVFSNYKNIVSFYGTTTRKNITTISSLKSNRKDKSQYTQRDKPYKEDSKRVNYIKTKKSLYGGDLSSTSSFKKPYKEPNEIVDKNIQVERIDQLTTVYRSKNKFNDQLGSDITGTGIAFQRLNVSKVLVETLKEMGISVPSTIQQLTIPEILKGGNDILFASQTGTGKTLTYLIPVIQSIKKAEELETAKNEENSRLPRRPRAIILVPTRELALQVMSVAKKLSHKVKFSCTTTSSGGGDLLQYLKMYKSIPIDVLISTPGTLIKLIEEEEIFFSKLQHLVIDEADSMFTVGKGFDEEIKQIVKPLESRFKNRKSEGFPPLNAIVCSATLTEPLMKVINEFFPNIQKYSTPTIHRSINSLVQKFIDIKGGGDKHAALLHAITTGQKITKKNNNDNEINLENDSTIKQQAQKRILIFCNSPNSCRSTEYLLTENDYNATSLHGEIPAKRRNANWKEFLNGDKNILVCTDIVSRGMDIPDVDHVILFDFPNNPIDYIHRIGRTARAGKHGVVTSLIAKYDRPLSNIIQNAIKKGTSLENLNKRINKLL
ncbi:ATP-dependent RNA helicase [Tieghemostelium lacteum]|uniref:ATP-dependent RNA helicase n=1 Tax=Tieghemostelium lacteum TaxID=361077 RepID=A0A152A419_TIELA|nr:ATP-dependent RNA helicase [Tieghemostelium lacteum]|eukprot:KYR00817.1 ATP-dependent RNA helicase [Tieghemostelium lacteum]